MLIRQGVHAAGHPPFADRDLWNIRAFPASVRLDVAAFDHLAPLLGFVGDVLAEVRGRARQHVPPRSASRALILGSARPALISLLSLSTISAGVAFGAPMPDQKLASKPGTNSPTVGMSGSASERVAAVTASARSLPALIYSIDAAWWGT